MKPKPRLRGFGEIKAPVVRQVTRHKRPVSITSTQTLCPSPAWWLLQGGQTRSHPELGRQTPSRQWYYVSRPGRVGRCQACQGHKVQSSSRNKKQKGAAATKRRALSFFEKLVARRAKKERAKVDAGWSSPVARQAHNLKVTGSNPVPATKSYKYTKITTPRDRNVRGGFFIMSANLKHLAHSLPSGPLFDHESIFFTTYPMATICDGAKVSSLRQSESRDAYGLVSSICF